MFEYLVNVMPQLISGTGITVKLFALTLIHSLRHLVGLCFSQSPAYFEIDRASLRMVDARNAFIATADLRILRSADLRDRL